MRIRLIPPTEAVRLNTINLSMFEDVSQVILSEKIPCLLTGKLIVNGCLGPEPNNRSGTVSQQSVGGAEKWENLELL